MKKEYRGVPVLPLLGLLFIGLKLSDHIDWSWWWVLAPFWLLPAFALAVLALGALFAVAVAVVESNR